MLRCTPAGQRPQPHRAYAPDPAGPAGIPSARRRCRPGGLRAESHGGADNAYWRPRREQAEQAQRKTGAEIHAIFDLAGIPMLIMDTRGAVRRWNQAFQKVLGYPPEDLRRMTIRDLTPPREHPQMLRRLSAALGDGSAYRLERRLITADSQEEWSDVSATPVLDAGGEVTTLSATCTDIHERRLAEDAQVRSRERLREALVVAIAEELGLSEDEVRGLRHVASVHDVRKVAVPAEILTMPSRLSEREYNLVQTLVEVGHQVLADIAFDQPVASVVLQHHERLDGSGSPHGLRGDSILLPARILAVADVVEAMASPQPHRPALGVAAALDETERGPGRLYDEKVVVAWRRVTERGVIDLTGARE